MKEKYGIYSVEIEKDKNGLYFYVICFYKNNSEESTKIKSGDWFDTQQEAKFAAIGHIDKLEKGESIHD